MARGQGKAFAARSLAASALVALAACQSVRVPPGASVSIGPAAPQREWEPILAPADRAALEALNGRWRAALAGPRSAADRRRIASAGGLVDADGALPRPELPPGAYHCRIATLQTSARRGGNVYALAGPYFCHVGVEGGRLWFARQTGPGARPGGYLYADTDSRAVFIGAFGGAREQVPPAYNADPSRNAVGVVERIGAFRYRLALARDSSIDIYDLTPAF